jgi:hypothetical protein
MTFAERFLTTAEPIEMAGRQIKRYHLRVVDADVDAEIQSAAYAMLPGLLPEPDGTPPATFTVLHQGEDGAFLLAYSWMWDNVLEYRTVCAGVPMLGCPDTDLTHFAVPVRNWIGCVWELAPLEHERSAWVRHLLEPARPDLAGYLADQLAPGPVGGPTAVRVS